ncbi:MAG: class I SAM-dependent methyltransferase [Bacillota bacterium]
MSESFYKKISEYYDYIFPVGMEQLLYIKNACAKRNCVIFDIACGTGGYSIALSKEGHKLLALDLDRAMVEKAKMKIAENKKLFETLNIEVAEGSMLEISDVFREKGDLLFCIGNSIAHLNNLEDVRQFLTEVKKSLKPGGCAIFQIINFDRVFSNNISSLPTLRNEEIGLIFERNYYFDKENGKVLFNTILFVEEQRIENTISLYPLLADDFKKLLNETGYTAFEMYGDFNETKYEKDSSFMLVIKATI